MKQLQWETTGLAINEAALVQTCIVVDMYSYRWATLPCQGWGTCTIFFDPHTGIFWKRLQEGVVGHTKPTWLSAAV